MMVGITAIYCWLDYI